MSDLKEISKLLVLIGGILGLIYGILTLIDSPFGLFGFNLIGTLDGLIIGIIQILISLIVLATSGVVSISFLKFDSNWIVYLILGIVMVVVGLGLPGILVIIGAILLLIK